MSPAQKTTACLIGIGGMARHHLQTILPQFPDTHFPVVSDPSPEAYQATAALFERFSRPKPVNEPDIKQLLSSYDGLLDAAFILSPHKFHFEQARQCLEAGLDVLLEKPMVMTAQEAEALIAVRDQTGRHLVIAFQGSLSPRIREAVRMLRDGELGTLRNISGLVWQNWALEFKDTWRQQQELSGGGFMFDTGAHLMNTVSDLAGEPFVEVSAWLDNLDYPVDILGAVIGRLQSGGMVTLNACGDAFPSCASEIRIVGTQGMLRTGIWGEFLEHASQDRDWAAVRVPESTGVWEQFQAVRAGTIDNPSPPEIGLRMAQLWDAIRASAELGGKPITI
jgi:predicted dehydrogenase